MKILLINGSPKEKGNTFYCLDEIRAELERNGLEGEILWLGKKAVEDCTGCGACRASGRCAFDDAVNRVNERAGGFAGIVAGSPIYYGGPNGRICSFLDRLFYSSAGKWKGKIGASVVVCRRGGATAGFERLNNYFLMNDMIMPGSQYWNLAHGGAPGEILEDAEGMQTMRTLAKNIAWTAGALADRPLPAYEKTVYTNFIR